MSDWGRVLGRDERWGEGAGAASAALCTPPMGRQNRHPPVKPQQHARLPAAAAAHALRHWPLGVRLNLGAQMLHRLPPGTTHLLQLATLHTSTQSCMVALRL